MTYPHEYDRDRLASSHYDRTNLNHGSGSSRWLLFALIAVVLIFGAFALFTSYETTVVDGAVDENAEVGTVIPAPETQSESLTSTLGGGL